MIFNILLKFNFRFLIHEFKPVEFIGCSLIKFCQGFSYLIFKFLHVNSKFVFFNYLFLLLLLVKHEGCTHIAFTSV